MNDKEIIEFWKDKQAIDIELLMNDLPKFIEIIEKQKAEIEKKDITLKVCEEKLIKERQERIKKDKIINLMAEIIATLAVNSSIIQKQIKEKYCEFVNSDEDCCWKTNKKCSDCVKEYIQKQVKEK